MLAGLAPPTAGTALLVAPANRLAATACLGHQLPTFLARCCLDMAAAENTRTSLYWLERNIVVSGSAGDRCGLEIPFIYGNVAALGGPVTGKASSARALFTRAQELHRVGNDIDCLALCPILRLPLPPIEASVECHWPSLGEVACGVLTLCAPH